MPLQLNSNLTKSLAVNFARLGSSARLILVSNAVPVPTDMSSTNFTNYLNSFMLTANAQNYLGSVVVAGYQNFNNSIVFGSATANALQTGTVGSIFCCHATSTGAPVANSSATGYINAANFCFFITDSVSIIDEPKMVVLGSMATTAGQQINHLSTTISMVSSF